MKQLRLETLADGIFAIVITLLVFHIRMPEMTTRVSEHTLMQQLYDMRTLFASYLLSFTVLFTYWRAHHFIASVYAKGIDHMFTNINALFFFLVGLLPFSSDFLGRFSYSPLALLVFALNIAVIGVVLYWMRDYATSSTEIENAEVTAVEERHAQARILTPIVAALLAILCIPLGNEISLAVLTVGVLFNLSRRSTRLMFGLLGKISPSLSDEAAAK